MNSIGRYVINQNRRQLLWKAALGTWASLPPVRQACSRRNWPPRPQRKAPRPRNWRGSGAPISSRMISASPDARPFRRSSTIPAGAAAPRHSHPGEEIAYVVEGSLEYALDGRPPVIVKAGEALFIPYGVPHAVKNVGSGKAVELATYFAEKGKPLFVLEK